MVLALLSPTHAYTIDLLVSQDLNCSLGNRTAQFRHDCSESVMQRLSLYIAAQQLYVARRRDEREERRELKIKNAELEREKETARNMESIKYIFGGLYMVMALFILCNSFNGHNV